MANPIKRLNYFDHQFLRAQDFTDEQTYHLGMRRLHNKLFHAWGIASGLQVTFKPGTSSVSIAAGMALDSAGNEIVLTDVATAPDVSLMKSQTVFVTVTYVEQPSDPSADAGAAGNTRYTESGKIEVLAKPADPSVNLVLARLVVGADGTVTSSDDGADPYLRRVAGASGGDLSAHTLTLIDPNNPVTTWPKFSLARQASTNLTGDFNVAGAFQSNSLTVQGGTNINQNLHVAGSLRVDSITGINQGRLFMSGGYGTHDPLSSISYNASHTPANDGWQFAEGDRSAVTIEMDDWPGYPRLEFHTTSTAAKTTWVRHFALNGNTGAIQLAEAGGQVSIGGPSGDQTRLDVYGRIRSRQDGALSAGLWLQQTNVANDLNFIGMDGDDFMGFYNGGVWGMVLNIKNSDLYVTGSVVSKTAAPSDVRLKEDISPITDSLEKVTALRGVSYVLSARPQDGRDIGVIAQEVETVLPELVMTSQRDGMKAVDYGKLTAVLIEAIKELKQQVDDLKKGLRTPATQS